MPIWLIVLIVLFLASLGGRESSQGVIDTRQAERAADTARQQTDEIIAGCRARNPANPAPCDDMEAWRNAEVTRQ